jgi:hypothetical protein
MRMGFGDLAAVKTLRDAGIAASSTAGLRTGLVIVDHKNPPDAMRGQFLKFTEVETRTWLNCELDRVFPKADALIEKMQLDVRYKHVTFETLNQKDFLQAVKEAFPRIDWDQANKEFGVASEKDG